MKFLPNNKRQGFTLIELLVVIAIIAVLAVMGFAAFRGFTGKGNDARRASDAKAIGDALEANRNSSGYYIPLAATQFASGSIPVDPVGGTTHGPYIIASTTCNNNTTSFTAPAVWTNATIPVTATFVGGSAPATCTINLAWSVIGSGSIPTPASAATNTNNWMLCYVKDDNVTVVCRNSAQ